MLMAVCGIFLASLIYQEHVQKLPHDVILVERGKTSRVGRRTGGSN